MNLQIAAASNILQRTTVMKNMTIVSANKVVSGLQPCEIKQLIIYENETVRIKHQKCLHTCHVQ